MNLKKLEIILKLKSIFVSLYEKNFRDDYYRIMRHKESEWINDGEKIKYF